MLVVIVLLVVALLKAAPHLLPYGSESSGPAFAVPHGIVLFIGGMCFIVFLAEGAALDWSAVFLAQERGIDTAYAGLGYAAFALTMTVGRLTGDAIVRRLGATRVIVFGGSTAAAGLALATFAPSWEAALVGYALLGAGCSNIVPVLYTAVGKQTVMPESIAVPAITTLGYAGILAGPAVIGFIAHGSSLSFCLWVDGGVAGGRGDWREGVEGLKASRASLAPTRIFSEHSICVRQRSCGSGLARESVGSGDGFFSAGCPSSRASLAPTRDLQRTQILCTTQILWERACPR